MTAPDELLTGDDIDVFALSDLDTVTTEIRSRATRLPRNPATTAINNAFGKKDA